MYRNRTYNAVTLLLLQNVNEQDGGRVKTFFIFRSDGVNNGTLELRKWNLLRGHIINIIIN
jgi:hypothetical protein